MTKILIIGPKFFGYVDRIEKTLSKNYNVDKIYTFYPNSFRHRICKNKSLLNYYKKIEISRNYSSIIVVNGRNLPLDYLLKIRTMNPTARFILYIWDDYKNVNHSDDFINFFDIIYTYSKYDSIKYDKLIYQPFFYSNDIDESNWRKDIEISFIGSLHSNRYLIYKEIVKNISGKKFLYLYSEFFNFFKKSENWLKFNVVNFRSLPYETYIKILLRSKISIEIPHKLQSNITTRAIEVLGTKTKLITTSSKIVEYDFYNEDNIFVLTDMNFGKLNEWSKIPFKNLETSILKKYSIDTWCENIIK